MSPTTRATPATGHWSSSGSDATTGSLRSPSAVPPGVARPRLLEVPRSFGVLGEALGAASKRGRRGPAEAPGGRAMLADGERPSHDDGPARRAGGARGGDPRARWPMGRAAGRGGSGRVVRSGRPRPGHGARRRDRRHRRRRPPRGGGRPPAPPRRGVAPGGRRHRQRSRPRPDPVRAGRPRHGPVRGRPRRRVPAPAGRAGRGRGEPRAVVGLPERRARLPRAVAAVGRDRRAPTVVRHELPGRPPRARRPRRRGPGGLRHASARRR